MLNALKVMNLTKMYVYDLTVMTAQLIYLLIMEPIQKHLRHV